MPCVENRSAAFQNSIRQMLSPELRRVDDVTTEPVPGYIYRTTAPSCLIVPPGYVADTRPTASPAAPLDRTLGRDAGEGGIALGPLPEGFPINALVNTELLPDNDEPEMWAHF